MLRKISLALRLHPAIVRSMNHTIGEQTHEHVAMHRRLVHRFGYDGHFIQHPPKEAAYVLRRCLGCGRTLRFVPLPGLTKWTQCVVCQTKTGWVVQEPTP